MDADASSADGTGKRDARHHGRTGAKRTAIGRPVRSGPEPEPALGPRRQADMRPARPVNADAERCQEGRQERREAEADEPDTLRPLYVQQPPRPPRATAALPDWLHSPRIISADVRATEGGDIADAGLSPAMVHALHRMGLQCLFPVQTAVIPVALRALRSPVHHGDLYVCAPTGSGKTLAYAVPIVEALRGRLVPRLRALVVLPTRDLATQVRGVFEKLTKRSGLRVRTGVVRVRLPRLPHALGVDTMRRSGCTGRRPVDLCVGAATACRYGRDVRH